RRPSITRDAAVTNPRDAHAVVDLLRERADAGNYSDRLRRLSIHSTCPHPTPSVHLWAGQHIQPHAHHQVEPTTRPVENSAAHIPKAALHALGAISANPGRGPLRSAPADRLAQPRPLALRITHYSDPRATLRPLDEHR